MPVLALKNEGKKNNLYIQRLFCADSAYPERKQLTQKTTAFKISFLSVQTMEKVQNELYYNVVSDQFPLWRIPLQKAARATPTDEKWVSKQLFIAFPLWRRSVTTVV